MYVHIGMNVYMWQERILGIFPATILSQGPEVQPFLQGVKIVEHEVSQDNAKACILTETQELHLSNVNYRTLRQRWNARLM